MTKVVELLWLMKHEVVVETDDNAKAEDIAFEAMESSLSKLATNHPERPQYVADSLRILDIHDTQ